MASALPQEKGEAASPPARDEVDADAGWPGEAAGPAVLALSDLISDANGEVVLFNDSGLRSLAVSADAAVVDRGETSRHVTATGEDVTGFNYLAFDNGLTLYYQSSLDLVLI